MNYLVVCLVLLDCCGNLKLADFGWSTKIRHADTM